jgi:ribonuclease HII
MRTAVRKLLQGLGDSGEGMRKENKILAPCPLPLNPIVLVDGNKKIDNLPHDQRAIVKGDRKIFAIACASVLAKVYRDRLMARLAKQYPGYGFEIHKGYGTVLHQRKIKELGLSPAHRRSFRVK